MPPNGKPRKVPEAISLQHIDNVDTRSGFGDNRAATENALMAAHAKVLRAAGLIGGEMEAQLSQTCHRGRDIMPTYTKVYLAAHPDYTGSNVHEMPSYEAALRRQKQKDAAAEKWLADYEAGKIDKNGDIVLAHEQSPSSGSFLDDGGRSMSTEEDHTGDTTISAYESSDDSTLGTLTTEQVREAITSYPQVSQVNPKALSKEATLPTGQSAALPIVIDTLSDTPLSMAPEFHTSATPPPRSQSSQPYTQPQSRFKRAPRLKTTLQALAPLPDQPTYAQYDYYALAALCREHALASGGNAVELRNRLIQDDTNVAQGKPRDTKGYRGGSRKVYKHGVPSEVSGSSRTASQTLDGKGSEEVEEVSVNGGGGVESTGRERDGWWWK